MKGSKHAGPVKGDVKARNHGCKGEKQGCKGLKNRDIKV